MCNLHFLGQGFYGGGLWLCVWHVDERGDPSGHSGTALGGDVGLVGQPRLAEVYVGVDNARHGDKSFTVDVGARCALGYGIGEASVNDIDVALGYCALVYYCGVMYAVGH